MREGTIERGKRGERIAVDFLRKKGYCILEQNYRYRGGEIDIVALAGPVLVFVEVKTRSTLEFGLPEEAVTPRKRRQIRMVAEWYCSEHSISDQECRCDVIGILSRPQRPPQIRHIENAF